jgi:Bacterial protein of unknown function (Gcw_chp)
MRKHAVARVGALALALTMLIVRSAGAQSTESVELAQATPVLTAAPQSGGKGTAGAADGLALPVSVAWDATLASRYIWQGFDYSDGDPVLQPELTLGHGPLSLTGWWNYDLPDGQIDEFDLYAQFNASAGRLSYSLGYAYFDYPNRDGWDPSQEVNLDLSWDGPLAPSLSSHYDFDAGDGAYFTLGVSHDLPAPAGSLSVAANLFYQADYYGFTGIPSAELNTSWAWEAGPVTVTPSVSYFATWENGDFRGADAVPDRWLFQVNVAQEF